MIPTIEDLRAGRTLAEVQGFTAELGAAVASLAAREAERGDLAIAREILEGLVVTNPRDALAWALLSQVERRRGDPYAAVLLAEAAHRLAPDDRQVRLARAEALLAVPPEAGTGGPARRESARATLAALQDGGDEVARRASALLRAMG
jgi:predicted Zn-dependent protease